MVKTVARSPRRRAAAQPSARKDRAAEVPSALGEIGFAVVGTTRGEPAPGG